MGDIRLPEHAVIDTAGLRALGATPHHIHRLLTQQHLYRVDRGIYTTAPPTGNLLLRALSHNRPKLVFSGLTALQIHSDKDITLPVSARVPYGLSARRTAQITIRQSRCLLGRRIDGIFVTTPVAAVADLATTSHEAGELIAFLEQQYAGRHGRESLETHLTRMPQPPAALKALIRAAAIGADSEAERRVFRELKRRGVEVLQNHNIGGYFFDGVLPRSRVIVEIDGYQYHSAENRTTFVRDRWKANYATRHGYRVLRYSGSCVKHHFNDVIEQIIAATTDDPRHLSTESSPVWRWHNTLIRDGPWWEEVAQ
ncbi:DUF559 domain-containing protein [Corynebacterium alimapuense]|uniref:DUF559 domain-containing protein n=1 Tax=Corynebacterium alimapuense TaxID=1576874 RepID=A0A3M8K4U4_9CORY|nr:DUF559 domain-containing protein [Corynebacterium alimapuense]RNE48221.1 hypothetical protein C5L39_10185 [Corynebacterium alimapuense]